MEPVRYPGTPPMITALANNELEISNLAYSTLGIAIQNAGLDDMRIIADEFRDGVEGYYSQEYMVLKDGPIQKVEDLKGKAVDDQRRRQRGRRRDAGDAAQVRARGQARLHHHRGAVPDHARDAGARRRST